VLRVLANLLGLAGFDEASSEAVRKQIALDDLSPRLNNATSLAVQTPAKPATAISRVANVPIYNTDAIVRRAASLQATPGAAQATARMSTATAKALGVDRAKQVFVKMNGHAGAAVGLQIDETQAPQVVQIPAGMAETLAVGPMFGEIEVRAV
jgi:NADH-quinone oxidoreductase subunit G